MKKKMLFFTAITSFALPMLVQSGYYQTPEQSQAGYYGAMGGGYDSRSNYPGSSNYESDAARASREAYQRASESDAARDSRNSYPGATGGTYTYPAKKPAGPAQRPGVKSGVVTPKQQIKGKTKQPKMQPMYEEEEYGY
jgi:hypothetical protein